MVKPETNEFEEAYTNLQCVIIAQVNKFSTEGLSATQYLILDFIIRNGPSTTSQLAKFFQLSLPAISRHIKKLTNDRFVIQKQDKIDGRFYFHSVTQKAILLVSKATKLRKTMSSEFHKILSEDDRNTFVRLCNQIASDLKL